MTDSYPEMKKHVDGIKIVDTHEHLPPEEARIRCPHVNDNVD